MKKTTLRLINAYLFRTVYNIRFGTLDRNKGGKIALATAVIIVSIQTLV